MRYLIIFLTLPFLVCATQAEIKPCVYKPVQDENRSFETSWEHSELCMCKAEIDYSKYYSINPDFYRRNFKIVLHGHEWIPYLYEHSDTCPCLKH